ncbi:MAG: AAA family ATPase [Patescibacteria group bacterium]
MKIVFLTCGPRGAGKSTYCENILKRQSDLVIISRDKILVELFGETELSPYGGGHYHAIDIMWERMNEYLFKDNSIKIILDCWNGFPEERKNIISRLKKAGADKVLALVFTTPLEKVIQWFDIKTRDKFNGKEMNESRSRQDYALFNKLAVNIEKEGFDKIVYINPLQIILI